MVDYNPPTENLPIFDTNVFTTGDEYITQNQADSRYLRFPNAQGTENLQAINVNGTAIFKDQVQIRDTTAISTTTECFVMAQLNNLNRIGFVLNPVSGAYNGLTQPNDNLLVFGDQGFLPTSLTIAPWSTTVCGIRMTQNTTEMGSWIFEGQEHKITTDTTKLKLTSSNVQVDGNLTSVNTSSAKRQITASYFNINDISANLTGTQIYQNIQTCFLDNNSATNGAFTFAVNDSTGVQQIPFQIGSTSNQSNKSLLINGLGNYLQFPDGTQQTTASSSKIQTITGTTTLSVNPPSNCYKMDVKMIGRGGTAGNPSGGYYGGSGGGGQTVIMTGIPVSSGYNFTIIEFSANPSLGTLQYFDLIDTNITPNVVVMRCYGGMQGSNATPTTGGAGGVNSLTATYSTPIINTNYGTGYALIGSNGSAGSLSPPTLVGAPKCVGAVNTNYGTGQRVQTDTLAFGYIVITYYLI